MSVDFDAVIIGAGFGGMYMLHRLRQKGFTARVFEAGKGVGGTWYWNRYPGARCDVESVQYSYQFSPELEQEWEWSERYATQPEILRYANHVADRFDLRRDMKFETRITKAAFDEVANLWRVETDKGDKVAARFVITAMGCLSSPNTPKIPGLEDFKGPTYHTGNWPHEGVDFTGKTVGVIGTGSSAIQSIPIMAEQAKHLTVFQRTANYTVPAHNKPLDPAYVSQIKASYPEMRKRAKTKPAGIDFTINLASAVETPEAERNREFQARWDYGGLGFMASFSDLLLNDDSNKLAADFVRAKVQEVVKDPKTAEALVPKNIIGCKRLCVDTGYWATFNRPNVTLVDISDEPVERITATGLRAKGQDYAFDCLVLATGFDAMTGALLKVDFRGRGGVSLKERWNEGPKTYLGLTVVGFPNLFMITGPGSPSVLTNMLPSIEQHVDFIADCLEAVRAKGKTVIEPEPQAQEAWVGHVGDVSNITLRSTCSSWYVGANIPGKPRVFMPYIGGLPAYIQACETVVKNGYEGFALA
ncbi:MAG: NAD(P)/FAD-dependent oxidoreductase [Alphaproteobacteria bacterium]|jgi:cyclohexanone monooxygenase|nr:NAD(P)/FAD-dependent oxidoreductase [Alphaproteobacteria bacterium]